MVFASLEINFPFGALEAGLKLIDLNGYSRGWGVDEFLSK